MKVMHLTDSTEKAVLTEGTAPRPQPGPGELLIQVHAAGVTKTELRWYPTLHSKTGEKRNGAVPGHEFSGVVAGIGKDVGSLEIGREVFGMNDWFAEGAMAEYCITPFFSVAPKPAGLTHIEAASLPIGALTAWQGLFDRAKLQPGECVLVHGGAGAVGVFAVQLARLRGAHVITTASAGDVDFVASLGAEMVINYQESSFEQIVQKVDVVFDTVGGDTLNRSWGVLKPSGRMVTIVSEAEGSTDNRVRDAFFIVEPNQKQLVEIGDLIETGRLRPVVDSVVPFAQAPEAYTGLVERRRRGKLVVAIAA
jgi:NADPH:quinone reductase-like Zn-dependent oxidoreductase